MVTAIFALDPPKHFDGTEAAQKALSCVYRVNQRFRGWLCGGSSARNAKYSVRDNGHDKINTYGIGKEHSHDYWVRSMRQLIHKGLFTQNITRNSTLAVNRRSSPFITW